MIYSCLTGHSFELVATFSFGASTSILGSSDGFGFYIKSKIDLMLLEATAVFLAEFGFWALVRLAFWIEFAFFLAFKHSLIFGPESYLLGTSILMDGVSGVQLMAGLELPLF